MEDKDKNPRLIAKYLTKPNAVDGRSARISYWIYSNGVIVIEKRMFIYEKDDFWKILRPFKDKLYCQQLVSFKYTTFGNIFKTATQELIQNNINPREVK